MPHRPRRDCHGPLGVGCTPTTPTFEAIELTVCHATTTGPTHPATALWPSVKPSRFLSGHRPAQSDSAPGAPRRKRPKRRPRHLAPALPLVNTPTPCPSRSPCTILACPAPAWGHPRPKRIPRWGQHDSQNAHTCPYWMGRCEGRARRNAPREGGERLPRRVRGPVKAPTVSRAGKWLRHARSHGLRPRPA